MGQSQRYDRLDAEWGGRGGGANLRQGYRVKLRPGDGARMGHASLSKIGLTPDVCKSSLTFPVLLFRKWGPQGTGDEGLWIGEGVE
jgi:hypothetical protein